MSPQQSIGHYRIVSKLGEGGMGAVYRATDTRLNRDVAIKVLPAGLAGDAARMARFEREAKVLASLNHPNIAAIYGVEQGAIVMELVDGEDLKGPVDEEKAIHYARQIAAGLQAAHEKGIVHRDLKPVNIKVTSDGVIKLLDFGLAKATEDTSGSTSVSPTMSPTMSLAMTQAGMILGTAAYMSPEQARGKPVDQRADIWAFGVVLYELLTGSTLFGGETVTDILASVVRHEPDLQQVPPKLRRLLKSCLQRDPKQRLQAIGDWELLLEHAAAPSAAPPAPTRTPWIAAALLFAALGGLAFVHFRDKAPEPQLLRSTLLLESGAQEFTNGLGLPALSPDGRKVVYGAKSADGKNPLWVRSLDSLTSQPLAGTDGATFPFWSPDSRYIAFFADNKLKKIDAAGGAAITLTSAPTSSARGGSWSIDGTIVFAPNGSNTHTPMVRVPAAGGTPVTLPKAVGRMPWFLPDGKHFLASTIVSQSVEVHVASLDGSDSRKIATAESNAMYAQGHLLFVREGALLAQPFDPETFALTGEAAPIAEGLSRILNTGTVGVFTVSATGLLAYSGAGTTGGTSSHLEWFDRTGKSQGRVGDPAQYLSVALSPDGSQVAIDPSDTAGANRLRDIWLLDLVKGTKARLTSDPAVDRTPVWSPDGSRVAFASNRDGEFQLFVKPANGGGQEEMLVKGHADKLPSDWSADGKFLLYATFGRSAVWSVWLLPMTGSDRRPRLYFDSNFSMLNPRLSPDGRWLVYSSRESGRIEIYVRPFPDAQSGQSVISTGGGTLPRWRRDGKELFYISDERKMIAVPVLGGSGFQTGPPVQLFTVPGSRNSGFRGYDVSPDGKKFLMIVGDSENDSVAVPSLTLIANWPSAVKK